MRLDHAYLYEKLEVLNAEFSGFRARYKEDYYVALFDRCDDSRQTWKKINVLLGRSKGKKQTISLRSSGSVIEGRSVADCFNEFFSKVGKDLASKVPGTDDDDLDKFGNLS